MTKTNAPISKRLIVNMVGRQNTVRSPVTLSSTDRGAAGRVWAEWTEGSITEMPVLSTWPWRFKRVGKAGWKTALWLIMRRPWNIFVVSSCLDPFFYHRLSPGVRHRTSWAGRTSDLRRQIVTFLSLRLDPDRPLFNLIWFSSRSFCLLRAMSHLTFVPRCQCCCASCDGPEHWALA